MLLKYGENVSLVHVIRISVLTPAVLHERCGNYPAIKSNIIPLLVGALSVTKGN